MLTKTINKEMTGWRKHSFRGWICEKCGFHAKNFGEKKVHERRSPEICERMIVLGNKIDIFR